MFLRYACAYKFAAFVLQHATFSHPTSTLSPNFPMFLLDFIDDGLWARRSEGVGLSVRAIKSKISNLCGPDPPTSQTDGRHAIAIPRFAL